MFSPYPLSVKIQTVRPYRGHRGRILFPRAVELGCSVGIVRVRAEFFDLYPRRRVRSVRQQGQRERLLRLVIAVGASGSHR